MFNKLLELIRKEVAIKKLNRSAACIKTDVARIIGKSTFSLQSTSMSNCRTRVFGPFLLIRRTVSTKLLMSKEFQLQLDL